MAVVASRSSLVGALIRMVGPETRPLAIDFLRGLSRDELECVAEFEGASTLDSLDFHPYRLLPQFFDPAWTERWPNADDCAHKTFILLAWLDFRMCIAGHSVQSKTAKAA